jgi:hypothetical protein
MRSTPYTAWLESADVASTLAPVASRTRRRTASTACVLSGSATLNLIAGLGPGGFTSTTHPKALAVVMTVGSLAAEPPRHISSISARNCKGARFAARASPSNQFALWPAEGKIILLRWFRAAPLPDT